MFLILQKESSMLAGIILIGIAILFLLFACIFATAYYAMEHKQGKTGKVMGRLRDTKHKKDVTIYGKTLHGGWTQTFIRHLTKGVYLYTVHDKTYKIRDTHLGTPRQMPQIVSVVYLKAFPKFAYIDALTSLGAFSYKLDALIIGSIGIMTLIAGISAVL